MGQPKALLPFDDAPLILHVVNQLRSLFPEVVVVAAPSQDLPVLPAPIVRDEVAYQGPVGGIYYGLAAAAADVCFVTSCDSVFLNPRLIRHVLSSVENHDVAVPYWQGRFQPLHAAYRRSVLPHLSRQLECGELRPVHLFDKVRTRRIDESEIREIDPEGWAFFNMNTPEDYVEALKRWPEFRVRRDTAADTFVCTVELFGVAQLLAHTKQVAVAVPPAATLSHVFAQLAEHLPALVGRVISHDRTWLLDGYACSLNGVAIVRNPSARVRPGDRIIVLAADAGG